jgi:hypothetical protein
VARQTEELRAGRAFGADAGVGLATQLQDERHVHQRLDVVDDGRLAEEPDLDRVGRLVARLTALALDRLEQGGLLAADVGAGSPPELDVEVEARGVEDPGAEEARAPGGRDRVRDEPLGLGVLAADVEVAPARADGVAGDRHRLDDGERVTLQQDAVLERPWLRLVGVAHDVLRVGRLTGDGGPLATRREGCAAAPHELRRRHLGDHAVGSKVERTVERRVAAVGAVVVERRRIDDADPAQEPQVARRRLAAGGGGAGDAGCADRLGRAGRAGFEPGDDRRAVGGGDTHPVALLAGGRHERGRGEVAQADARRSQPADRSVAARLALRPDRPSQVLADPFRPGDPAGDVVADVGDDRGTRLRRIQGIERGDAVGLGGRHREATGDVVEGRLADPADPILDGMERRQQLGASRAQRMAPARGMSVHPRATRPADPTRLRRPQDGVHGGTLRGRGQRPDHVEVHRGRV